MTPFQRIYIKLKRKRRGWTTSDVKKDKNYNKTFRSRTFFSYYNFRINIDTQCVLELFCEMLIMLIRQGEVRKWLNGESFICGVFRFCYGAGGVWVNYYHHHHHHHYYYYYYYCLVFLSVRLILSLIRIKQTFIHPAFPETRDSLIPQKSIFNILSINRTLANTISIQSLKTPKIYAHMLIQFQDHVKKYSQTDEPANTSQYTRPQITKQRWTNRTDNEYRYYSRNDQFQIFKCFILFTSDSKNGPT